MAAGVRLVFWRLAPVDGDDLGDVGMAFEPGTGERAKRHDGQALAGRPLDSSPDEPAAEAPATQGRWDLGVQQDQTVSAPAVRELGDGAIDCQLEARVGAVVDYLLVLVHATIVASCGRARAAARLTPGPRSGLAPCQQDFRPDGHEPCR